MAVSQLCWKCKNAYADKCEWFSTHKHPDFVKVNKQGFIIECSNFKSEKNCDAKNCTAIAKEMGIHLRTFMRHKETYLKEYEQMKKGVMQ